VGVDFFTRLVTGELRPEDLDSDGESGRHAADDRQHGGADQVLRRVLSHRERRWHPPSGDPGIGPGFARLPADVARGTTVYEIDQPDVIEFKTRTLAELGAEPTAERRAVAMDLRYDWPSALIEEGFDPNQPTAWSAEACSATCRPMHRTGCSYSITELSAPGSRVAVESVPNVDPADHEKAGRAHACAASERWREHGFDLDFAELVYLGDRNEAASYFGDHGWQLNRQNVKELFAANGLQPLDDQDFGNFGELQYVSGRWAAPVSRTDADSWGRRVPAWVRLQRWLPLSRRWRARSQPADRGPVRRAAGAGGGHRVLHSSGRRRDLALWRHCVDRCADEHDNRGAHPNSSTTSSRPPRRAGIRQAVIHCCGPGRESISVGPGPTGRSCTRSTSQR